MPVETTLYTTLRGDDEPVEEIPAEIITYTYRLNRPGSLSFSLALDHEFCRRDVIGPGTHEVVVVRNRAIVWRGPVWTAQETDTEGERKVTFGAEGLFSYTRKMFVTATLDFTGASAADLAVIARALINHHQNKAGGDFGIDTTGSETTRSGERIYPFWERKNIFEAIVQLAEVQDGFDFEVDHETRRFIAHYPQQGQRQPDQVWQDGIRSFTRTIDATGQASEVLGIGEGEGSDMLLRNRQTSSAVVEYGLTQARFVNKDVKRIDTLDDHVRRELALTRNPSQTVGVTFGSNVLNPFSYPLGTEGRLVWDSPYEPVNESRRRVGFDVVWDAGEETTVEYLEELL